MLRTAFLSLILIVSFSSGALLRKSISRRQDQTYCQAIEGFDCKCSSYRVTCSTDRELPQALNVLQQEKQKYPSVELLINGERDQNVYEYTFEPVKQLFKSDGDSLEFRVKFEKFTALHLHSPGVFNKVFPDNAPATARKHLSVEIYNPTVQPNDNINLFANLNVDLLELYVTYPFRGTFQQLFTGANVKYLRLSGGDIRTDSSQPFTGNIGRLELAKQANQLTTQNFPIYPAHELIINAYYVSDFNSDNPPNYSNLDELRVYTQERIPANAFRHFPNLRTLSVTSEKDIDPHAFDGLSKLEKLTIKDAKPSLDLLNNLPNLKELEVSLEKFDEREQCDLVDKTANGKLVVQGIPSGRDCTCAGAYLDSASGRYPCDAQDCDRSSCPAIQSNYDAQERKFKSPPAIQRADGTDAFRQREAKVYSGPYHITNQDLEKSQQQSSGQSQDHSHAQSGDGDQSQQHSDHYHPDPNQGETGQTAEGNNNQEGDGNENRQDGEGSDNRQDGDGHAHHQTADGNQPGDANNDDATEVPPTTKRKLGWLTIGLIIAAVVGLLLVGLIVLIIRRRSAAGYNAAPTTEHGTAQTAKA
uniref:Predicted protein n=1 Tax=Hordeum vulgare subsp. vulgare TaxID=112509 RepID=F2DSJ8_HORVV|nr:predicted protein [Hordeum vulgare subsp. vulgare]